jgi:ABC-type nickel/cobalt efflux system permease component RcnA
MLLVALAFAWLLQMVIIAQEGSAYFIENNNLILYGEITGAVLIIIFGLYVLITQIRRLGERRVYDRRYRTRNSPKD